MSKKDLIEKEGIVTEVLANAMFRVEIKNENGDPYIILAHLGGQLRTRKVRIILKSKVKISMSPYDKNRGIVTGRINN